MIIKCLQKNFIFTLDFSYFDCFFYYFSSLLLDHANVEDEGIVFEMLNCKCNIDSVMIDGSSMPLEDNIQWTAKMVLLIKFMAKLFLSRYVATQKSTLKNFQSFIYTLFSFD